MKKTLYKTLSVTLALLLVGCTGGEREDTQIVDVPIVIDETIEPNHFLAYVNRQASLAAGTYEVSVATATAGETGDYQLEIVRDNGSVETVQGEWSSSGGMDPQSADNPRHAFTLQASGGLSYKSNQQLILTFTFYVTTI